MTQEKLVELLGRPLTTIEVTNFKAYIDIAFGTLSELLCASISRKTETRTFESVEGYSTVFTDYFTDVSEVKIDGSVIDSSEYSVRQWDKRDADWYNSIVFDTKRGDCEVEITADWGFGKCLPNALELLVADLFANISTRRTTNTNVASKQVEDFRITFRESISVDEQFSRDNAQTLGRYSMCSVSRIRNGAICYEYDSFLRFY